MEAVKEGLHAPGSRPYPFPLKSERLYQANPTPNGSMESLLKDSLAWNIPRGWPDEIGH